MKFLSAAAFHLLLLTPFTASAVTFLVDLGTNATGSYPSGSWNAISAAGILTATSLVDSAGNAFTVSFIKSAGVNPLTGGSPGTETFNAAAVPAGLSWLATSSATNLAAGDWLYTNTNNSNNSFTTTFSGLTIGSTFSLDLISSRNSGTAQGFYEYSLDSGATWVGLNVVDSNGNAVGGTWAGFNTQTKLFNSQSDGYTNFRYMNVSGITLTDTTLLVRATDNPGTASHFAGLNAIRLDVIPEPTSIALLAIAGSLATLRRKRK